MLGIHSWNRGRNRGRATFLENSTVDRPTRRKSSMSPISAPQFLPIFHFEPKRFLQIRGGHNDGFLVSDRAYADGLDAFLTTSLVK